MQLGPLEIAHLVGARSMSTFGGGSALWSSRSFSQAALVPSRQWDLSLGKTIAHEGARGVWNAHMLPFLAKDHVVQNIHPFRDIDLLPILWPFPRGCFLY
jgi:hypothetical protein